MERIVLYDGVCGLCNRAVAWLIARDGGQFRYAQLQGETAAALRRAHPNIPTSIDTVVFVDGDRAYLRAKAFFRMMRYLPRPWRWLAPLGVLPSFLIDLPYRLVARIRYRIWGKVDACRLPAPGEAARLLP